METIYYSSPGSPGASRSGHGTHLRPQLAGTAAAFLLLVGSAGLSAQTQILIPNGSFESPAAGAPLYAAADIGSWQKTPVPPGYDTNVFGPWEEKSGVFFNLPNPEIIDNVDGFQAAFLFAFPGVGFFQDYNSVSGTNSAPSQEFDAVYNAGKSYRLTAGFTTSTSFPLLEGAMLKMILYYLDGASNRVTVAETTVTYSTNTFANPFHLVDHEVSVPSVDPGDPWAGKYIGIEFVSTTDISLANGIWDVDHVRLIEFVSPTLTHPAKTDDQFGFLLLSDPGAAVEVLGSTNAALAISNWTSLGILTNTAGLTNVVDPAATGDQRLYTARQLP